MLPQGIKDTFNRIFDAEHFSIRCFKRSVYFSIGAIILTSLIYVLLRQNAAFRTNEPEHQFLFYVIALSWSFLSIFLVDYLYLLKTRVILGYLSETIRSKSVTVVVLISDFVIGYVLFATLFSLYALPIELLWLPERIGETLADVRNWPAQDLHLFLPVIFWQKIVSPAFYAGMLPSIWLWIFVAAVFVARFLPMGGPAFKKLLRFLDIERKPFRSVGIISAALVFAISAVMIGIAFIVMGCCAA